MKFQVSFEIIVEDRADVEKALERVGEAYTLSESSIQSMGPDSPKDCYSPELTSTQRAQGWCLQLDGVDQVMGIPPMDMREEYNLRAEAVKKIADASNLEEHKEHIKAFFKLVIQLCLGDNGYFDDQVTVEKMRALVSFSFSHPQAILPPDARESFLDSEYTMPDIRELLGGAPPKDQMN